MSAFELLLVVHILAAMLWIGGAATGTLLGTFLRRSGDVGAMSRYCIAFASVAGPLFGGSAMLVLLSGIGMVAMDGYPAWGDLWIVLGLVGWLVSTVMGATIVGRSWVEVGKDLAADGASLDQLAPRLDRAARLAWADLALRVAVVVIMVWRPT